MAYNKDELEKLALQAIKENGLVFDSEVWAYIGISEKTYYNHQLQELQTIKESLRKNRITAKTSQRRKWADSDNATLQLAHYKLIAEDEERKKLSQTYTDVTTDGDKIQPLLVKFIDAEDTRNTD